MVKDSKILDWDSDFFGKKVASLTIDRVAPGEIEAEISSLFSQGCDLIYLFSPQELYLDGYDAVLADRKVSYVMDSPVISDSLEDMVRYTGDPSRLHDLAIQSGEYSRYRIDKHFAQGEFERLYRQWIDNSVNNGFADYVFVIENQVPVGMITAKVKGDELCIGLFATDTRYRGKGIGSVLITKVVDIAARRGLKVEVTTQMDNSKASRFYESKGFVAKRIEYVYHIWRNE